MYLIFRQSPYLLSWHTGEEGPERNDNPPQLMSTFGGALNNARARSLVIYHHCRTVGHNLIKDDIHVYTLEITSDEYLIWLSLVYYCTRLTDNKVLLQ